MTAFCVCVPARNEVERLPVLLDALAAQTVRGPVPVALCINDSDDGTAEVARATARRAGDRLAVTIVERSFAPAERHAGSARRVAMDQGAERLGAGGVLVSTDADCRPPPQWIAAILDAMVPDAIVGGRIEIDDREPLLPAVASARAALYRYWSEVRRIEDAIDPCPWDPPPRHGDHTGASLALGVALYRAAGGVPCLANGEDRALVENARSVGGRLMHPPQVWTRASPRIDGRAEGGMAATMAVLANDRAPPMVPAFRHWEERARWRRDVRRAGGEAAVVRGERLLPAMPCDMALAVAVDREVA